MAEPIPVDANVPITPPPIPVGLEQTPTQLPKASINALADKTAWAFNKDTTTISDHIESGNEKALREGFAAELNNKKLKDAQDVITNIAAKRRAPLSTQEENIIYDELNKRQQWIEPKSVFEYQYSQKFIDTLYNKDPLKEEGSMLDTARRIAPNYTRVITDEGKDFVAFDEYVHNRVMKAEARAKEQDWGGWAWDRAKNLLTLGIYSEFKERGAVTGDFLDRLLAGSNEQRNALMRLPFRERIEAFDRMMDKMEADNAKLAAEWGKNILGLSATAATAERFGGFLTAVTLPGTGAGIKAIATRGGVLREAETAVKTMVEKNAQMRLAPKFEYGIFPADIEQFSHGIFPSDLAPIVAHTATGNLAEAGIKDAARVATQGFKGESNPLAESTKHLSSVYQTHIEGIANNPGTAPNASEVTNRLVEDANRSKYNIMNMISNMMRVNRISEVTASEDSMRLIREAHKADYKYLDSHTLDVKGPHFDPNTNNLWFEHQIGQNTGEMFPTQVQAAALAKEKGIGLKGQKNMERQTELTKDIAKAQEELKYYRTLLMGEDATLRGEEVTKVMQKLGLTESNKTPDFAKNMAAVEARLEKSTKELDKLRSSPGATIEQQGDHFYISYYTPLRETSKAARDLLLTTSNSKTPDGLLTSIFNRLRSGEETTSKDQSLNARIAVQGADNLLSAVQDELKELSKLGKLAFPGTSKKERWLNLEQTIKHARTMKDPNTGEPGYMFQGLGELNDHYLRHFNRTAHESEARAYFAIKRHLELVDGLKEIRLTTNKLRIGTEEHTITTNIGGVKHTATVEGVLQKDIPQSVDHTILLIGVRGAEDIKTNIKKMKGSLLDIVTKGVEEGALKVVRIVDPERNPLAGFGVVKNEDRVRFVITPTVESRPLSRETLSRHKQALFQEDFSHYVSQARMRHDATGKQNWYEGDINLAGFMNGKMARDVAKVLETVREHLQAARLDKKRNTAVEQASLAKAQAAAAKLGFADFDTIKSWFAKDGPFNVNEKFHAIRKNEMVIDVDRSITTRPNFKDGTREGSDIRQSFFERNNTRDIFETISVGDKGTRHNPIYYNAQDRFVDPIPSINRSMSKIVNSLYMEDFKMATVEHWIAEAKKYIKADSLKDIERNPFHYFNHGELAKGTPFDIRMRLNGNRYKAQQLIGTPSKTDTFLHDISEKLADTIYGAKGETKLDPSWMIPKIPDAARAIRAMTYHTVIGLFSLPQIVVQNMNYVTMAGVAGYGKAGQGVVAALFHGYAWLNPKTLPKLDEIATHFGWRPGELTEAHVALGKSGFMNIGAGHSLVDNPMSAKVFQSAAGDFLDFGTVFFRAGEKSNHAGAWYIAYKEFRDLHPHGALTPDDIRQIFGRAELLSGNMNRAAKSIIETGPLSFATQFMSYNLRLIELMTGKRLDTYQRARLFLTMGAMYGMSAAGIAGYPFGESLRKAAIERGYQPGNNFLETLANEGIPSYMLYMITGKFYNVGDRFGSPGMDQVRDIMSGDINLWKIMGGATYSQLSKALESGDGLRMGLMSILRGDEKYFKTNLKDLTDVVMENINSLSLGQRVLIAINKGIWYSKAGRKLEEAESVKPWDAILRGATGLQALDTANIKNLGELSKDRTKNEKLAEKGFLDQFEKATLAYHENNTGQGDEYMSRAQNYLIAYGYPPEKMASLFSQAAKGNEALVNRAWRNFLLRNVPPAQRKTMTQSYEDFQKLRGNQ